MSSQPLDDAVLAQFLLGALPEAESEKIEELSITDDSTALRLQAIEHDLIDAYVRGELSRTDRARFKSSYLATPERRNRVAVANALRALDRPAGHSANWMAWAAAVVIAAVGIVYFAVAPRIQERPAPVLPRAAARLPVSVATPSVTLVLLPPTRGMATIASLRIPKGTADVHVRLQLESDDFPAYEVALRDLAANQVIWRSTTVTAKATGVSVDVPATGLKEQNYSLELSGVPAAGEAEVIASYPFRVTGQ